MLTELRKFFSSPDKEKKKERNKLKLAGSLAASGGAIAASSRLAYDELISGKHDKVMNSENAKKVKSELLKQAKKQGTKVVEDYGLGNSFYTGTNMGKFIRKGTAYHAKYLRKKGESNDSINNKINKISSSLGGSKKSFKNLGKDTIIMGGGLDGTDLLSHEIGHSKYMVKGRSKMGLGKLAHKGYELSANATSIPLIGGTASIINGYKSGVKSQKLKSEGKKESTWNKNRSWIVPTAIAAPMLVAEAAASRKGIKMMKSAGANKELLNASKRRLGAAWGTYAGLASANVGLGQASRYAGKLVEKKRQDKSNK